MDKVKVYIITQNEPFFIPKVIQFLLTNKSKKYKIIGITNLAPHRKNKNYKDWFKERSKIYTYRELFIVGMLFLWAKVFKTKYNSVNKIIEAYNLQNIKTNDINTDEFIEKLKKLQIDVVVSISCPQLFSKKLIDSFKYCINAHGTLLPRHRGVFGSWWMLFEEDNQIGGTIHFIDEKVDTGAIIWQKAISTPSNPTQYKIAFHTKKLLAEGLKDVLENIHDNNVEIIPPVYKPSYHRAPTKSLNKQFRKKGKKIITINDVKLVLKKHF